MAGPLIAELSPRSHAQSKVAFCTAYTPPPSTALLPMTEDASHDAFPAPLLYRNPPKSASLEKKEPPVI